MSTELDRARNLAVALEQRLAAVEAVMRETCREESSEPGGDRCGERAVFVLWGKLFPSEAFGPRCYQHAVAHTSYSMPDRADQWAVLDLRPALRDAP